MIFVTVGTGDFNQLAAAMDAYAQYHDHPVIIQTGRGGFVPRHCDYFDFAPTLEPYIREAEVVVSHGGFGTLTEVLRSGTPLVAVEDASQPDRHQREIIEQFAADGFLVWCRDLDDIAAAIDQALQGLTPYQQPECTIHTHIHTYLKTI